MFNFSKIWNIFIKGKIYIFFFIFQSSYGQDDEEAYGSSYVVGSFSKEFVYGPDDPEQEASSYFAADQKPKILLMGLRRLISYILS